MNGVVAALIGGIVASLVATRLEKKQERAPAP